MELIEQLPSAQPEIIRCKDCKHRPKGTGMNHNLEFPDDVCPCQCEDFWYSWMPSDDWFCKDGERIEEMELPSVERTFENLAEVIARHEEIGYEKGWKDGYAQAVTENEPERRHKYD